MKKMILTFFTILLLNSCLAAVNVFRRIGAEGTFDITVVDDNGKPMPNIQVEGYFPSEYSMKRNRTFYVNTDQNGKAIMKGSIEDDEAVISAWKEDYYRITKIFDYPMTLKYKKGERVYLPYRDSAIFTLRRIIDPVPLYEGVIRGDKCTIPNNNGGFDLVKNDWVKPYGNGEVSDCFFTTVQPNPTHCSTITTVNFPNPGDGIAFIADVSYRNSDFCSPNNAPDTGYFSKADSMIYGTYFFKIRSKNGEGGIYGRFNIIFASVPNSIVFDYVYNPTGSRNLEMDQRYGRSVKIGEPWKLLGRGARADLLFKVVDPQGNPIPKMKCSFHQPSDDEHFPRGASIDWISDAHGMSPLFHNWIYNKMELDVAESEKTYWSTQILHYPDTLHYDESGKEVWKPWTDTIVIVPKMKIKPVKAKEVDFKAVFTPLPGMRLPYDILMNQPVYPYGDGKVTDCYLSGTRKLASDTEYEYTMTLEFAKPWEGIKPRPKIVEPPDYSSSFKGEYKIPEEGFQSKWTFTKRLRRDKGGGGRFIEDYYIRFRTKKDSQGRVTQGEFGTFNCYFARFFKEGRMEFSAPLSLNPDNENNIEFIR